ncbi:MAG: glycosyltransferase family 1 protein [Gammaproteobacteria bacterium]|nr:glycosyltransferase family 1 protein [Gammaproteobacteria bacterium]
MHILIAPYGSRGDVEPMVALAHALHRRGHSVLLAAPPDFRSLVEEAGVPYHPVAQAFSTFFDRTRNELRVFFEAFKATPSQFEALETVMADADAVVGGMLQFAAPTLAEFYEIPYFYAVFSPCYLRSLHQPALSIPLRQPPQILHRMLWGVQDGLFPLLGKVLLRERQRRRLGPVSSLYDYLARTGQLFAAVDSTLTPVPPDVGPVHVTGLWRRAATGHLPDQVEEFLNAGAAPVYIGFGSMGSSGHNRLASLVKAAADQAGVRVLYPASLLKGSSAPSPATLPVPDLLHDLLFPRVSAVVHHGGAGTFASAALAGRPQGIVAHLGDQYYHGYRVEALGLGPAPLHARFLSHSRLSRVIVQLTSVANYASCARALASRITTDGAEYAAMIIESAVAAAAQQGAPRDDPRPAGSARP